MIRDEAIPTDDLLKLARFHILDRRNCNEAAKDQLLLIMANRIEFLTQEVNKRCPRKKRRRKS